MAMQVNGRSQFWLRATGLAVLLAVLGVWFWIEATPPPRIAPPSGQALFIDKSAQAQSERKAVIGELLEKGLVRRIDHQRGGSLRVVLRATFYLLDEMARRRYIEAVYAYYFDGSNVNDTVILRDAQHGNEIGQYNPYKGGLRMYR
jgi:hypothetical protein